MALTEYEKGRDRAIALAATTVWHSGQCGEAAGGCECDVDPVLSGRVFGSLAIPIPGRFHRFVHKMGFSNSPSRA
jgi:hypothetical protein